MDLKKDFEADGSAFATEKGAATYSSSIKSPEASYPQTLIASPTAGYSDHQDEESVEDEPTWRPKWRRARVRVLALNRLRKVLEDIRLWGTSERLLDIKRRGVQNVRKVMVPERKRTIERPKTDCMMIDPNS